MLISKIHLPRRRVLKAIGATVGLPLLDAMIPAGTALAQTAAAPRPSLTFVYFPHGAVMDRWTPATQSAGFELPPILAPLRPWRRQLTIVTGLENKAATASPVHAITPGTWLSCAKPRATSKARSAESPAAETRASEIPASALSVGSDGISVDQVAAARLGRDMRFASLAVATETTGGQLSSDSVYGDDYGRTLSFRAPASPLPMEHDPRKVFARLFGQEDDPSRRDARIRTRRSVLDLVLADAADLRRQLGPWDRALLGDYLANVRAVERRVQAYSPEAPRMTFADRMNLMFDLIALAYQANATRVATFMMAAEVSNQSYAFMGVPDSFHSLSHHQNNAAKLERLAKVQAYNTGVFARFVGKLATTPDGDGSLLDHSVIVYGSNMSNSNLHDHVQLPLAIVGGGCGRLRGDLHLRCPDPTPLANLHVALLNKVGIPTTVFGDSTGALAGI